MLFNNEVKVNQNFEQFQNDLYDHFYEHGNLEVKELERMLITNFQPSMPQTWLSKFLGVSERTIRNKKKEYGL